MNQLTVPIPPALQNWVDMRLAQGRYSGPADYICDLIRRDEDAHDDHDWVLAMIDEGLASPILEKDAFDVLDEIIAEIPISREAA